MGELRCSPETVQLQSLGQPASTISTGSKGTVTIGPPTPSDNNSVQAPQTPPASTTTKRDPSSNVSAIITHYYPTAAQNLTQHFVPIEGSAMRPSNPDDPKITVSPRYCENFLCQNWIDDYTDISSVNTLRSSVDSELNQWVEVDSSTLMSLDELPENVLIHVMMFCDAVAVCRLGVTCRKLHSLSESPVVWKHLFDQRVTVDPAEYQIESYKLAYKLTEPAVCSSCGARFQPLLVSKEASCYGHKGYATVDVVGATYLKPVWSCCRQLVLVGSKCTVPSKHVVDSWGKWGKRAASVAGAVALSGVVVVANAVATLHP
ncbi:hypothetical protein Pelo_6097 [Pelomyxa schiedti]|nr:hypothetical protein Pelo_6097 [Pelomyxa schiedti]